MVLRKIKNRLNAMLGNSKHPYQAYLDNHCSIAPNADIQCTKMGRYCNVAHDAALMNSSIGDRSSIGRYSKLRDVDMGKFCSISWDITIGAVSHPMNRISSHAITYRKQFGISEKDDVVDEKRTIIGNDVWIGCNAVVLSGITVGDGAIIGAGAVVTKDVESYSVVAGVPAKHLKYRFENDVQEKLRQLKWWDQTDEWLTEHIELFRQDVTGELLQQTLNDTTLHGEE